MTHNSTKPHNDAHILLFTPRLTMAPRHKMTHTYFYLRHDSQWHQVTQYRTHTFIYIMTHNGTKTHYDVSVSACICCMFVSSVLPVASYQC